MIGAGSRLNGSMLMVRRNSDQFSDIYSQERFQSGAAGSRFPWPIQPCVPMILGLCERREEAMLCCLRICRQASQRYRLRIIGRLYSEYANR